jgi:hypothetical protein
VLKAVGNKKDVADEVINYIKKHGGKRSGQRKP